LIAGTDLVVLQATEASSATPEPSSAALIAISILAALAAFLYYSAFVSSRAATIPHHRKQVVEAMWGRLLTCGRLVIGLPLAVRKDPRLVALVCGFCRYARPDGILARSRQLSRQPQIARPALKPVRQ
jgi:hypothetical protein